LAAQAAKVTALRAASAASALRRPLIPVALALSLLQASVQAAAAAVTLRGPEALGVFTVPVAVPEQRAALAHKALLS
jgi:hypothetical protein